MLAYQALEPKNIQYDNDNVCTTTTTLHVSNDDIGCGGHGGAGRAADWEETVRDLICRLQAFTKTEGSAQRRKRMRRRRGETRRSRQQPSSEVNHIVAEVGGQVENDEDLELPIDGDAAAAARESVEEGEQEVNSSSSSTTTSSGSEVLVLDGEGRDPDERTEEENPVGQSNHNSNNNDAARKKCCCSPTKRCRIL